VVLCGDNRLLERFSTPDLKALGTRLRPRLALDSASPKDLADFLRFAIENAGNPRLMTHELLLTLAEHSAGNYRVLCGMAADLLAAAADKELSQLDEKLFLEIFAPPIQTGSKKPSRPDPFR
jgi:type II secretory pathway predicted ATPase ExeA